MRPRRFLTAHRRTTALAVATAVLLAVSAVPVSARPYGAVGERGEPRYGSATIATPRCVTMTRTQERTRPLCFHWATTGAHAASPGWVDSTVAAFTRAAEVEITELGYRLPPADGGSEARQGPNKGLDVYLANIAGDGTLGYCTADRILHDTDRAAAYCVVDNDFAELDADAASRRRELRGTAAHELFHAIQSAYDTTTPKWLSEGTAVAMEDRVFDGANTHYRYLDITALRNPEDPFDRGEDSDSYGAWLFWEYMGERHGDDSVRRVWNAVAAGDGSEADIVAGVNAATGQPLGRTLADFASRNYGVGQPWSYLEGAAYFSELGSRRPPLDAAHTLTATRRDTDLTGVEFDGLPRSVDAGPRTIHYVRITATESMTVDVTVSTPGGAALMHQRPPASFDSPVAFADATESVTLAADESAIVVLTNPSASAKTLTYRAVAP